MGWGSTEGTFSEVFGRWNLIFRRTKGTTFPTAQLAAELQKIFDEKEEPLQRRPWMARDGLSSQMSSPWLVVFFIQGIKDHIKPHRFFYQSTGFSCNVTKGFSRIHGWESEECSFLSYIIASLKRTAKGTNLGKGERSTQTTNFLGFKMLVLRRCTLPETNSKSPWK